LIAKASANGAEYGVQTLTRLNMIANASANGAEYDSQGQAPNNVRRVAPG